MYFVYDTFLKPTYLSNIFFFIFSAKKDLMALWTSLESIRDEVMSLEMANDEMKILCNYFKETTEENETMYYLIPKHLAKKGKLKKRGTKLHICQDHMFLAKHIKR